MELALFDFDHTVTAGDSYGRFLRRIATPQQLARARWTLGPWLLGYRIGLVSAVALRRRATHEAFAGRHAAGIAGDAERFAAEELPAMLRPEMAERIARHRDQGHRRVLVSASSTSTSRRGAARRAWNCSATGSKRRKAG